MAARIIRSKHTDEVWLKTDSRYWSSIPAPLRGELVDSLDVVAQIRAEITRDAPIKWMPLIEAVPVLWKVPGGKVHGLATATLVYEGDRWFGVQIPAQTALCLDLPVVRAVLVHEFDHCFYNMCAALAKAFPGEYFSPNLPKIFDPLDAAEDELRMVDPHSWFGRSDAETFMKDGDNRSLVLRASYETLTKRLKQTEVEPVWPKGTGVIPLEVIARIKELSAETETRTGKGEI